MIDLPTIGNTEGDRMDRTASGYSSETMPVRRQPGARRTGRRSAFAACIVLIISFLPLSVFAQTVAGGDVLTLSKAIDTALANQPTIAASQCAVRASEARIGEALSSYYPQVSVSGAYSRISPAASSLRSSSSSATTSSTNNALGSSSPYNSYTSSATLSQNVYDFGKTANQVRINRLNTESARFDLSNTRDTVVLNVKQAYFNALQTDRNLDVAKQAVRQFQEHLEQARGFYAVGTKAKFDVTKAEVDLSNAELNLITAENQVRQSRVTLNNAMGIASPPEYALESDLLYTAFDLPFEKAVETAYAQRPDLQSLIKRKEASKESVNLARKGYFPQLTGSANYYYSGTDFPLEKGWTYGLNISIPIFTGFLTKYQVAEARANLGTVEANERSLRLDIYSQVQQGYLSLREAAERTKTARLAVRQAKENVELATGRYQEGVGSPLEVTDAVVALSNAEVAYTSALTDYKNAQAAIEKAIGERS
jgi:outer membrane protein TolC